METLEPPENPRISHPFKDNPEFCPNCMGGKRSNFIIAISEDDERCPLCLTNLEQNNYNFNLVATKINELEALVGLYRAQHALADPMRSFNLKRISRVIEAIDQLENLPLAASIE